MLRERVEAMKAIWTQEEASYHGQLVDVRPDLVLAQACQRPYPPALVGGNGPGVLDRMLAFGDAWFPNYAPEGILDRAAELRSRADRPVELMVMGVPADAKVLQAYADAGFRLAAHELALGRATRSSGRWTGSRQRSRSLTASKRPGQDRGGVTARVRDRSRFSVTAVRPGCRRGG